MPPIIGYSREVAIQRLEAKGLQAGTVTTEPSETVMEGYVIRQSAPADSPKAKGEAVDFVVSSGPSVDPEPEDPDNGTDPGDGTSGSDQEGY